MDMDRIENHEGRDFFSEFDENDVLVNEDDGEKRNFKTFLFDSDLDDEKDFFVVLYGKN